MAGRTPALEERLRAAAAGRGVALSQAQVAALVEFIDVLLHWRRRLALVSQATAEEVIDKHVDDSLALTAAAPEDGRAADLGSGAGFPGLVLATARPGLEVKLVESQRRKASFLRDAVRVMRLVNVEVIEARAETLPGLPGWEGSFDLVASRAVWSSEEFFALALPLLAPGGTAVAMKTPGDMPAVPLPRNRAVEELPYELAQGERRVLLLARRL